MDQLAREQTQRLLANQMRDARLQRQKQVRQQAMAWTEATRRRFEQTKEREIKGLANAVTGQVQNAAMLNIEELTRQNDLAMAEIGMAHRAAAGFQNVERMKSLKRLRNEEVANNRGSAAMIRHLKEKETEKSKSMALLKRKEQVRKIEDKLSKELISRRPLTATNSDATTTTSTKPKAKLGPPEYQQSIAKTLKTVSAMERMQSSTESSIMPSTSSSAKVKKKVHMPPRTSSSDLALKGNKKRPILSREGLLKKMVRIKASSPSKAGLDFESEDAREAFSTVQDLYGVGYKLRSKYMEAARGTALVVPTPVQANVRYFDSTIPKGEVKYVAPLGLAVKETSNSPDAWEKGKKFSNELLQQQKKKTLKEEKISQKAAERGKKALKRAKLEKEILQVRNELLEDLDFQLLGTGSQKAILGLEEKSENEVKETDTVKPLNDGQSSDEFSAVDSDDDYIFPDTQSSTLKKFDVIHDKPKEKPLSPKDSDNKSSTLANFKIKPKKSLNDSSLDSNSLFTAPSNPNSDESSSLKKSDRTPPRSVKSSGTQAPPLGPADDSETDTQFSEEMLQQQNKKTSREDEIARKAAEKMKLLLKKAKLRKQISQEQNPSKILEKKGAQKASKKMNLVQKNANLKKENPQEEDQNKILEDGLKLPRTGSQKAIQGSKEESENKVDDTDMVKPISGSTSSDEFLAVDSDDEYTFPDSRPSSLKKKIDVMHKKSEEKSSGPSDSDKSSALISIKIKTKPLSNDSTPDSSTLLTTSSNPNSDESSALVNLKIIEKSDTTPSRSDKSSGSTTTDYYSPPDGPFTSTPDGKLHHKGTQSRSSSSENVLDNLKRRTLHHYLGKFLERRPDSIEKLPVNTSQSSVIRADSDVLETASFQSVADVTDGMKQKSIHLSRHSSLRFSSDSASSSKRALSTLYEDLNRADSGSTIAETAIVAGKMVSNSSITATTATTDTSEIQDETPPTLQNTSSTDHGLTSSDSLTGLIRVLSSQQELERQQLGFEESSHGEESEKSLVRSNQRSSGQTQNQLNQSSASSSSRDSIPDASAILKRLMKKQSARNSSGSSGSNSSRSGPEKETKRVELLDDVSPIKLWETPPRTNQSGANDTQKLSAVFETLIDKWSNMRIEKPPWTANSEHEHDQKEEDS